MKILHGKKIDSLKISSANRERKFKLHIQLPLTSECRKLILFYAEVAVVKKDEAQQIQNSSGVVRMDVSNLRSEERKSNKLNKIVQNFSVGVLWNFGCIVQILTSSNVERGLIP